MSCILCLELCSEEAALSCSEEAALVRHVAWARRSCARYRSSQGIARVPGIARFVQTEESFNTPHPHITHTSPTPQLFGVVNRPC